MSISEILKQEDIEAIPDWELLHRMQRLRQNVESMKDQIARCRENPYGRAPDWTTRADGRLKVMEAGLQQVRDEGKRRLDAALGPAA